MDYSPSAKELSHFPFLKKAQDHVKNSFPPIDVLLAGKKGAFLTELAVKRINQALSSKKTIVAHFQNRDDDEIAGYVLSRILVSCINDKQLLTASPGTKLNVPTIFSIPRPDLRARGAGTRTRFSMKTITAGYSLTWHGSSG